jgi:pimeloyl-ACP methyl ester carboxylesterase
VDRLKHRDRLVAPLLSRAVPCRLINGSADPNSGDHLAQRYRALLPQADIVSLPGVGHWPQLEVPEAVTESLLEFVLQHEHGRHPGVAQATNLRQA